MKEETLRSRVLAFLRDHDSISLATVGEDGQPHAAAVFFAPDEAGRLVFLSDPATAHGQDLLRDGRVAGTVHADVQAWASIQGVQLRGRARPTDGPVEHATALEAYRRRFPGPFEAPALAEHLIRARTWVLEIEWMRLIDNRRGFGHKEEG